MDERVLVSFPLSPSRCLILSWVDDVGGRVIPASSAEVGAYNLQRAYFAERYLYADRQDDAIRELGQQYKGGGLRLKFSAGDKWAPISVKRRLRRR